MSNKYVKDKKRRQIKYQINLDPEQRQVKSSAYNNQVLIVTGRAGTGKSSAVAVAVLDMLFNKEVVDIRLSRPAIELGKTLGYLKGDVKDKFDPYVEAFMDSLFSVYKDRDKLAKHVNKGQVNNEPLQFIRGKNINAGQVLIVDEVQNTTKEEVLAILTRLGVGGKIILLGDVKQTDLKSANSGLKYALELSENIDGIKHIELKTNHRSGIVKDILDYENKDENKEQEVLNKEPLTLGAIFNN